MYVALQVCPMYECFCATFSECLVTVGNKSPDGFNYIYDARIYPQFNEDAQQRFKETTASVVNEYCSEGLQKCSLADMLARRRYKTEKNLLSPIHSDK